MSGNVIIGAGPGGLTAAFELHRLGQSSRIIEKDLVVGGISRTVGYKGYRFDIGGHRFFTKVPMIQAIWEEILGDDFLERPRLSRIFYDRQFFDYPLKPLNALQGLGPLEAGRVGLSYLWARLVPHPEERNFEQWVSNRFGRRLYEIFFKTYTEKVWGLPCTEISADWAAQRIKNLDLVKAVRGALLGSIKGQEVISTLIDRFHYPRFGPGMMWERCGEHLESVGSRIELGARVVGVHHSEGRVDAISVEGREGTRERVPVENLISSMPLPELVSCLEPAAPDQVSRAAQRLSYRDFLIVVLIVDREEVFPDNWIYIHSPDVIMGRIQNFKNWSPEMVPDSSKTSLGLEYFVNQGDEIWSAPDNELVELGIREMAILGLIEPLEVDDGTVVRMPKAYPVYDGDYQESVGLIRGYLAGFSNLQVIGRNGQHRYNNQDHSMLAGVSAARNVIGENHDVWSVNVDQEYLEEVRGPEESVVDRLVPQPIAGPDLEERLRNAFAHFDPIALGTAVGVVTGVGLFLATARVLLAGGNPVGPNLSLLNAYFLGFRVTWSGALLGWLEASMVGFALGYLMARSINLLVSAYENAVRRKLEMMKVMDPLTGSES